MIFETQNKIRFLAVIISAAVVVSMIVFLDLIDSSIKSYLLCIAIALGAGFVGLQLMPESVKSPWLYIPLHIVTTLAIAILLVFALVIGNYAP